MRYQLALLKAPGAASAAGSRRSVQRRIAARNKVVLNHSAPGQYYVRYRALIVRGRKTVATTKWSPIKRFVVAR